MPPTKREQLNRISPVYWTEAVEMINAKEPRLEIQFALQGLGLGY